MTFTIRLPWPPAVLNPNSRVHWHVKAKAAAAHKSDCRYLCQGQDIRALGWDRAAVRLTFCPPDRRRRDRDNMLASCKALIDAVAAAAGIDDSRFELTIAVGEPVKHGCVVVEISRP